MGSWWPLRDGGPVVLTVAPIICNHDYGGGGGGGGGGDKKYIGGNMAQQSVVVEIPGVETFRCDGTSVKLFMDKCVESEVVVVIADLFSPENKTVIFVVDTEKTFNDRSLIACCDEERLESLFPGCGAHSFLVKTVGTTSAYRNKNCHNNAVLRVEESTGVSTHMFSHVDEMSMVSDSLLCVSFRANKDWDFVKFYHTDDLAHPLNLLPQRIKPQQQGTGAGQSHPRHTLLVSCIELQNPSSRGSIPFELHCMLAR
ncbi:hypothetical protein Pelo_17162 [Pelomyxa schiedti]|nr:hypothetical protein Pelo_17162 [Pelomyxa schiedti]